MTSVILLEPDRVVASCIEQEFISRNISVSIANNADRAVELADANFPDAVICELSIPSHSGSEFLYEFRTYTDWTNIPIIIFSSIKPSKTVTSSKDWKLLNIHEVLYKPDTTLQELGDLVESVVEK
jgi:DNA-binding response OmpR family regulator